MTEPATGVIDAAVLNPAESEERAEPAWGAVVSLALGVFGLVTAEFLPASLLTPMAPDLGITEGVAGQAVTATAVVGAIAAPTMAIVTRRIDRRLVMWGLTVLLIALEPARGHGRRSPCCCWRASCSASRWAASGRCRRRWRCGWCRCG